MTSASFAHALYNLAKKSNASPKELVKKLQAYLASNGRLKLLPGILQELQKIELQEKKRMPVVEIAKEHDKAKALKEAAAAGVQTSEVRVNPSLITGWRAVGNGKLYDSSAKRSLIEVYRKITT
jgi:F0F1-type ATP synthase delta subunit